MICLESIHQQYSSSPSQSHCGTDRLHRGAADHVWRPPCNEARCLDCYTYSQFGCHYDHTFGHASSHDRHLYANPISHQHTNSHAHRIANSNSNGNGNRYRNTDAITHSNVYVNRNPHGDCHANTNFDADRNTFPHPYLDTNPHSDSNHHPHAGANSHTNSLAHTASSHKHTISNANNPGAYGHQSAPHANSVNLWQRRYLFLSPWRKNMPLNLHQVAGYSFREVKIFHAITLS